MKTATRPGVDRTPQPCLHKVAAHQHGTNAAYVLDKCRCLPCSEARAAQDDWRRRQQAYGRYDKFTDATPVRAHIRELMATGMGLKRIIVVSGVSSGTIWKLVYGKKNADGVQVPSARVLTRTAEKILATKPDLAGGALTSVEETLAARLKLRALVALGWSLSNIAARLDVESGNMHALFHDAGHRFTVRRIAAIEALFEECSMALPPEDTHRTRQVASRSRNYARRNGWLPPLAIEDVSEALEPADLTDVDEVAVARRLAGDKTVRLNQTEKRVLVARARAEGWSLRDLEERAGISKAERYYPNQQEAS